jgi:hypothetical protein
MEFVCFFLFISRGLFTKILSWQAKQSIPHTTVMFYGDCVKTCEDCAPNFGDKRTGYCITTTRLFTLPFSPGIFFTKNKMTVVPTTLLFSVAPIEDRH